VIKRCSGTTEGELAQMTNALVDTYRANRAALACTEISGA
jgi:hypothetical protein